jgi:hypothetical protein
MFMTDLVCDFLFILRLIVEVDIRDCTKDRDAHPTEKKLNQEPLMPNLY